GIGFYFATFSPAFDSERIRPKVVVKRMRAKEIFILEELSFLPLQDNPAFLFGSIQSKHKIISTL
ncbi:MAG: hypothetical protein ABGZ08_05140, partial [Akkermansiaceae bacterium]